jgi:hypothetical protein
MSAAFEAAEPVGVLRIATAERKNGIGQAGFDRAF